MPAEADLAHQSGSGKRDTRNGDGRHTSDQQRSRHDNHLGMMGGAGGTTFYSGRGT